MNFFSTSDKARISHVISRPIYKFARHYLTCEINLQIYIYQFINLSRTRMHLSTGMKR